MFPLASLVVIMSGVVSPSSNGLTAWNLTTISFGVLSRKFAMVSFRVALSYTQVVLVFTSMSNSPLSTVGSMF